MRTLTFRGGVETHPFHPSIWDIVARFAENRGYQKTRALIRLLRHAVRSARFKPAWRACPMIFEIGATA